MKRFAIILALLAMPALACNLTESPTPVPTPIPPPVLQNPVVGLSPVSGPPGTVVKVSVAGFPAGAGVNLYIAPVNATNPSPAANLTVGTGGILTFAMQLPNTLNGTPIPNNDTLVFTVSTADRSISANAIFLAFNTAAGTTPTAATDNTGGTGGTGSANNLFITSPAIGAAVAGGAVVVTGSGSAINNQVIVQVLDPNNNLLGSATATIQAASGAVGPWQTTVGFAQPAATTAAYIVAYTVTTAGGVAQQASIPITLVSASAPTNAPTVQPTNAPTVPPVITGASPFITATPKSQ